MPSLHSGQKKKFDIQFDRRNKVQFEARTLDNGLKVIYVPMDTAGSACSNIVYNVGSCDELDHERGLAHQLEHAQHFDSKITDMELNGAILNATTSYYRTNYYFIVPYNFIKSAISKEAARMKNISLDLIQQRLGGETVVIYNEMEGGQVNPFRNLTMCQLSEAFRLAPNSRSVIGTKPTLRRSVDLNGWPIKNFHDKNYTPDNATYVLAGPWGNSTITINELHEHVVKEFGDITKKCEREEYMVEPQQQGARSYTVPGDTTMLALSFTGPPGLHKDSIPLCLLSSCFTKRIQAMEKQGLCMQSAVMWDRSRQKGLFSTYLIGFQDPQAVKNATINMICSLQSQNPISSAELNVAKEELYNTWSGQLQSTQGVCDAFTESIALGHPNDINTKFQTLENVNKDMLTEVARKYLVETNCTTGLMLPYKLQKPLDFNYTVPAFTSVGAACSAKLLEPPHCIAYNSVQAQSLQNTVAGSPTIKNALWKKDGLVWAGVSFTPKVDTRWFATSMGDAIKDPRIQWESPSPGMLRVLFYCQPNDLNSETLNKIWGDPKDYSLAGKKGHMMINGLSGDVNKYAEKLTQDAIFDIPQYNHKLHEAVAIVKQSPRTLVSQAPSDSHLNTLKDFFHNDSEFQEFVPKPALHPSDHKVLQDKPNVKVIMSQAIPKLSREHKDFIPLKIASDILGYGFHGDLMHQIRIKHGLTYGSNSSISPGFFMVQATFPPRNLEKGVADMQDVLQKWRSTITSQEIEIQKSRLKLMPITLSDKPENFLKAYHTFLNNSDIEACSLQDVLTAFDTHIDISKLTVVQVG